MQEYRRFKGTASEYRMLHYWVQEQLGKPQLCTSCGTTDIKVAKRFEWANKSGEYKKDLNDWVRMCSACHGRYDMKEEHREYCQRGHKLVISNLYSRGSKSALSYPQCRKCMNINRLNYRIKHNKTYSTDAALHLELTGKELPQL